MIKRVLKITGFALGIVVLAFLLFAWFINEPLPNGKTGTEADALATKMLTALNYTNYKNTRFLEWSFKNNTNHYKWDKTNGIVIVKWDDIKVELSLKNIQKSIVFKNKQLLEVKNHKNLINKALSKFNNDSFWLVAPYKVFDKGTTRKVVVLEDGTKGLLVTYTQGGTTPGDSYLWKLNPNGFPNAYQMWVKIIPIGGIEATWDDWITTESGAFLPKTHKLGLLNLDMLNIRAYN